MQTIEHQKHETKQFDHETRRYYDTVTWLAEVLPGSMRTPFEYQYYEGELYANDGGKLGKIFDDAIEQARQLPAYELRRRLIEKQEYQDMLAMMEGDRPNTMVVVSDFPPELLTAGSDTGGYNTVRKQTMLRVLTRTAEGTLMLHSQSLDGSNRQALEGIYEYIGSRPEPGELLGQRRFLTLDATRQEFLIDQLCNVYDRSLQAQFGGNWYAGRQGEWPDNTYQFACQQHDLVMAYLATTEKFSGDFRDYALAAAVKARFVASNKQFAITKQPYGVVSYNMALDEMYTAGGRAQSRGEIFSGCGKSIGDQRSTDVESQLGEAGYGNKTNLDKDCEFVSKSCPKCGEKNVKTKVTKTHISGACGCRVKKS
jgi:hypothetical protein